MTSLLFLLTSLLQLRTIGREDLQSQFSVNTSGVSFWMSYILLRCQVKGGGHAFNVGSSSTTGVHISMAKFSGLEYDAGSNTVTIGTGLTWDQVYTELEPLGVMVTGGRINGVGKYLLWNIASCNSCAL